MHDLTMAAIETASAGLLDELLGHDEGPEPEPADWTLSALCAQTDPEVFFPQKGVGKNTAAQAKRVCAGCTVRVQCLEEAMDRGETHGVWGGKTPPERAALRRRRRQATQEVAA